MDRLSRVEESYERTIQKSPLPYEVKKAVHSYMKELVHNADSLQNLLKEEIGLKERYHRELLNEKASSKKILAEIEELVHKKEKEIVILTQKNESLNQSIVMTTTMLNIKKNTDECAKTFADTFTKSVPVLMHSIAENPQTQENSGKSTARQVQNEEHINIQADVNNLNLSSSTAAAKQRNNVVQATPSKRMNGGIIVLRKTISQK